MDGRRRRWDRRRRGWVSGEGARKRRRRITRPKKTQKKVDFSGTPTIYSISCPSLSNHTTQCGTIIVWWQSKRAQAKKQGDNVIRFAVVMLYWLNSHTTRVILSSFSTFALVSFFFGRFRYSRTPWVWSKTSTIISYDGTSRIERTNNIKDIHLWTRGWYDSTPMADDPSWPPLCKAQKLIPLPGACSTIGRHHMVLNKRGQNANPGDREEHRRPTKEV